MNIEYFNHSSEIDFNNDHPLIVILFSTNRDFIHDLAEYSDNNRTKKLRYTVVKSSLDRIEVIDGELHYMLRGKSIKYNYDIQTIIEDAYDTFVGKLEKIITDDEVAQDNFYDIVQEYITNDSPIISSDEEN